MLDGRTGDDTVIYQERSEYTVVEAETGALISGPEGADQLVNVEWVHFADGRVAVADLFAE